MDSGFWYTAASQKWKPENGLCCAWLVAYTYIIKAHDQLCSKWNLEPNWTVNSSDWSERRSRKCKWNRYAYQQSAIELIENADKTLALSHLCLDSNLLEWERDEPHICIFTYAYCLYFIAADTHTRKQRKRDIFVCSTRHMLADSPKLKTRVGQPASILYSNQRSIGMNVVDFESVGCCYSIRSVRYSLWNTEVK